MAIEVKDLAVEINDKLILENVSVSVPEKKVTSVIGPNGAGKSTLLKVMGGINTSYSGKVFIDGVDIRTIRRKAFAQKLAILPQGMQTPADVTVRQLVDYGRFPYRSWFKSHKKEDEKIVDWAMEETQVSDLANRQVMSLSGGERQRAWIAMALAQKPEILLLDEPTTYLDIAHQLEVMEIVTRLNKDLGLTVLMVLHDLNQAVKYSDYLVVIKDKGVYTTGSPEQVMNAALLREVFSVKGETFTNSQGATILSPVEVVR